MQVFTDRIFFNLFVREILMFFRVLFQKVKIKRDCLSFLRELIERKNIVPQKRLIEDLNSLFFI